jgi:hypothetical protein
MIPTFSRSGLPFLMFLFQKNYCVACTPFTTVHMAGCGLFSLQAFGPRPKGINGRLTFGHPAPYYTSPARSQHRR